MEEETITTYKGFVERFREVYFEEIKPLIEEGAYQTAACSLNNIVLSMRTFKDIFNIRQVPTVHFGLTLLTSIDIMHQLLREGKFDPTRDFKTLEAGLTQTKLPTRAQLDSTK